MSRPPDHSPPPGPSSSTEDAELAFEILRSIRRILRRVSQQSRHLSRVSGLTVPQYLCMKAIREADGSRSTVARVAAAVRLSTATVSRILDRLATAGYVVKARGEQDRRKVWLSLTKTGRERLESVPTPLQEQFLDRLHGLGTDEKVTLRTALERIVDMMEAGDIDGAPMLAPGDDVGSGA